MRKPSLPNSQKSPIRQTGARHFQKKCTSIDLSRVTMMGSFLWTTTMTYDTVPTISTMKLSVAKILQITCIGKIFLLIIMYFQKIFNFLLLIFHFIRNVPQKSLYKHTKVHKILNFQKNLQS